MGLGTLEYTVFLVIVIAVAYFFIFLMDKKAAGGSKKEETVEPSPYGGVTAARKAVAKYSARHGFRLMQPAHIVINGRKADLDALVITYSGVVGVRCYGYNGTLYANPKEENWMWTAGNARKSVPDPLSQCAQYSRVIRDALMPDNRLHNIPVDCFAVFTDKKLQLAVPKDLQPMRTADLMALLEKDKYLKDTGIDQEAVFAALNAASAEPEKKA